MDSFEVKSLKWLESEKTVKKITKSDGGLFKLEEKQFIFFGYGLNLLFKIDSEKYSI